MTTEDINTENTGYTTGADLKPLGFWLRTVDALINREFADAFDGTGASRRDWMILNVLSGDVSAPGFAERLARKGKRLSGLAERGWVQEQGDGTWTITDEGRAAQARLGDVVEGIRTRVAGAVSPEDFATTITSLEAIARELGWDENSRMPRGGFGPRPFGPFGRGRFGGGPFGAPGFGPNMHRGFRPGHGPDTEDRAAACGEGHGRGDRSHDGQDHRGHEHDGHEHRGHHRGYGPEGRGRRDGRRGDERAYERGFDAGFTRGQASASASDAA